MTMLVLMMVTAADGGGRLLWRWRPTPKGALQMPGQEKVDWLLTSWCNPCPWHQEWEHSFLLIASDTFSPTTNSPFAVHTLLLPLHIFHLVCSVLSYTLVQQTMLFWLMHGWWRKRGNKAFEFKLATSRNSLSVGLLPILYLGHLRCTVNMGLGHLETCKTQGFLAVIRSGTLQHQESNLKILHLHYWKM